MDIAKDYGITAGGVRNVYNRLKTREDAENLPRTGRPRKTSKRDDRKILMEIQKNPKISAKQIKEDLNLDLSVTRIKERIKECGYNGRVARKKPYLSKENMVKRKEFAKQYKDQPLEFWKNVIFSDESKFELMNNKRREFVWRKPGEAYKLKNLKPSVKHGGGSIMVWGCFSYHGVGKLVFIDGIMNGPGYIDILENNLEESARSMGLENDYVFQQDNDPKHTCKLARQYFDDKAISLLPWSSSSPDINPIEPLWDEIDRRVPQSSRTSRPKFKQAIQDVWYSIPKETLQKLVMSVPNRLHEVWKANGGHTRY